MKHKTVVAVLRCAKRLLEKGWVQGSYATTKSGKPVDEDSPSAAKFCMLGAIKRCDVDHQFYYDAREFLQQACEKKVHWFNDLPGRKKKEVLEKYDVAIRLASSR